MIPKKIWQTHEPEFSQLPSNLQGYAETWKSLNPEYTHNYVSATERSAFVRDTFNAEIYSIYESLPVNVMKADMWRLLVTYFEGGIYVDMDSVCNLPIDEWILKDKSFIVGPEHTDSFVTSTFACSKEHPIMGNVIENMIANLRNADYSSPHIVHRYTGPWMFTRYVLEFLDLRPSDLQRECAMINASDRAIEEGFFMFCGDQFSMFTKIAATHMYGAADLSASGHPYWVKHHLCAEDINTVDIHIANREWRGW